MSDYEGVDNNNIASVEAWVVSDGIIIVAIVFVLNIESFKIFLRYCVK